MHFQRDILRRDRRRRLWPSLFVLALISWAIADIIFTTYPKPEPLMPRRMIERHTFKDAPLLQEPALTARQIFRKLLEDYHFNDSEVNWKELLNEDIEMEAAEKLTTLIQLMIGKGQDYAPCRSDASLDPIPDRIRNIFVASNLKDNEQILPNMIKHLMLLILSHPEISFYISIYESGSKDKTPFVLKALDDVLEVLEIDHVIAFNGTLTRHKGQGRIEFLSTVRNAAIRPLIANFSDRQWDRILFINDVMFCSEDLHRLLLHEGDIVCGMDFIQHKQWQSRRRHKTLHVVDVKREYYSERLSDIVKAATTVLPSAQRWERSVESVTVDLASSQNPTSRPWMEFYDIWVSHDISGRHFINNDPYIDRKSYSHERLKNGLPFPVECCWNGAAVLNPEPFLRHNVQFRSGFEGECQTSECVLLCHDFQRLGYNRVIMDPSVRLTYTPSDAHILDQDGVRGIGRVSWEDFKAAEAMMDIGFPFNRTVDCCNITKNKDLVDFKRCKPNYNLWTISSAMEALGLVDTNLELLWNRTKIN